MRCPGRGRPLIFGAEEIALAGWNGAGDIRGRRVSSSPSFARPLVGPLRRDLSGMGMAGQLPAFGGLQLLVGRQAGGFACRARLPDLFVDPWRRTKYRLRGRETAPRMGPEGGAAALVLRKFMQGPSHTWHAMFPFHLLFPAHLVVWGALLGWSGYRWRRGQAGGVC